MIRLFERTFISGAICAALALGMVAMAQAQSITFIGSTTSSDYSNAGLDLGNDGFWFANFGATAPQSGQAIDANQASSLPSWVALDPTPDTTFSSTATTSGGQPNWATLTLPDGTTGLSGAVVDSNTNGNSNNTIRQLHLGPGVPSAFFFHVVTDNTAGQHDPASRLRARAEDPGNFDISAVNTPPGLAANMDGSPDVYTWRVEGMTDDTFLKLQMNSGNDFAAASISGLMFDVIPEPSSLLLILAGTFGFIGTRRHRRR